MGVDSKKAVPLPLPAPTETDSTTATDLATDVSRPHEQASSYSLPDDGTPVTIKTRGHKQTRSQTSLLIEYFEGGKAGPSGSGGGERKPSVRVRLTPSKNRKNDHIQITETKSTRKASLTRRSGSQTPTPARLAVEPGDGEDANSMTSYASATEESNVSRNPIEVEIDRSGGHRRRRPASPLIPPADASSKGSYQLGTNSEISAIPTDSFLDGSAPTKTPEYRRSRSPSRTGDVLAGTAAVLATAAVADKVRSKVRSEDKEKLGISKSRDKDKSDRKHKSSKSRTSSFSEKEGVKSPRRRSSRSHQESMVSGADSSMLSSGPSQSHRSYDQRSVGSGASKSSLNNPKLLETVEDAIRRLILPELNALKREQSRRTRRSSASSGTSASRDDYTGERRRSGASERHTISPRDSITRAKESRQRESRHDIDDSPAPSVSRVSVEESVRGVEDTPSRTAEKLAAGAAAAALAAAALQQDKSPAHAREQRRRRRAEAKSRGGESFGDEHEETDYLHPGAPMPLMSEINPSEMTRTSILSADTEGPRSASEELTPTQEVARHGFASVSSNSPTPTKTGGPTLQALGAQHANISHGDLKALPREGPGVYEDDEFEVDEHGRPLHPEDEYDDEEYDEAVHGPLDIPQYAPPPGYDQYGNQVVPAPLKYTPYQPERRGLSPIPSVSGYTEGGSEIQANRDSRVTTTTTSSPEKSQHDRGLYSPNSIPSNMASREFDHDERSLRSSGVDYRQTQYTDDSELDPVTSGQAVRGVGANPNIVHSPIGVESAVASLVDGSVLDDSVLTGESGYVGRELHRDSMDTLEEERSYGHASASRQSMTSHRSLAEEQEVARASPATTRTNPSEFAEEYDIDQYGRKVQRTRSRQSPTASETAITAGAVGLAIKAARDRNKQPSVEEEHEETWVPAGVQRNKSFKEHTLEGRRPANTPSHSVDRLVDEYERPKMGFSGFPDSTNPDPEIGFGYDHDLETNPSVLDPQSPSQEAGKEWPGDRTPTQQHSREAQRRRSGSWHGLGATETAGAAALATAAALAAAHHSRQPSQEQDEEWQRTSDDRKRDTLVTNPYEGASPVVKPGLNDELFKSVLPGVGGFRDDYAPPSPLGHKVDEGYISQGPIKSPDARGLKGKGVEFSDQPDAANHDDPFYTPKHARHLSGMSQGMASPFYDAATGAGIDRIENRDIVALMQHVSSLPGGHLSDGAMLTSPQLMVRDAQRSARDTEILVTLVRAAAEMRNEFDNVKTMLSLQEKGLHSEMARRIDSSENAIITELMDSTEKTVRSHIGGPRPLPGSGARSIQGGSQPDTEDFPTKKRHLFRRALKGLSAKGNNDLGRIEDMLNQLLGEVDALKSQTAQGGSGSGQDQSFENVEAEVPFEQDRGYEPEGHAGTSTASHASQSGHLSINSRGPSTRMGYERKFSDHRISTVPEANEDDDFEHEDADATHFSNPDMLAPPPAAHRGSSVPLGTPPQAPPPQQASLSNENTPRTDKGKKHKSGSSTGWLPKISRWSETTTSSVGRVLRGGKDPKKGRDLGDLHSDGPSRSGSDLAAEYEDYRIDPEGDDQLHTGFSEPNLHQPAGGSGAYHQPMPPHPRPYMTPEDPKYKAHRNSLNLQHPQPRSGQPFRAALESGAEQYGSPGTPRSAEWAGSVTSLGRFPGQQHPNRYSNESASQEAQQYWTESPGPQQPTGPPRPPKEPLDEVRRTPPKSNRISKLQKNSPLPYHSVESGYATATHGARTSYTGSPRLENRNLSGALGVPTRRPSGPRAMTPKSEKSVNSLGEDDSAERRRKRGSSSRLPEPCPSPRLT